MQKISFVFAVVLSFAFSCSNSYADRTIREKIGPNVYKIYRVKDPEIKPKISWREKTTTTTSGSNVRIRKEILHETVCSDYKPGSIIYRHCRQDAKELFEERCEYFDKKYRETKRPYDKEYEADRDMYCRSVSSFGP